MDITSIKDVPKNMRRTGMLLFRDALMEALYSRKPMCVVHAAHAAEILLKARIAQEHPFLIFSKLPKADSSGKSLTLMDLIENGRTFSYEDLPDQLWATTGTKIDHIQEYREFGRLRNQIIHFSMTNTSQLDELTIRYSLELLDPLIETFWGRSVIEFITKDPDDYYANFVNSGLLEDQIRQLYTIDNRLRKLLGDSSKNAWERMNDHREETNGLDESKTDADLETEYEAWRESSSSQYDDESAVQLIQAKADWDDFLSSF